MLSILSLTNERRRERSAGQIAIEVPTYRIES